MYISKEEIKGEKKKEVDILKYRKVKVFNFKKTINTLLIYLI